MIKRQFSLTFLHLRHTYYAKHILARFIKGLHKTDFPTSHLVRTDQLCTREASRDWMAKKPIDLPHPQRLGASTFNLELISSQPIHVIEAGLPMRCEMSSATEGDINL